MLTLAIVCVFVGGALGLRFNVFVLIPAVGFALVFVVTFSIACNNGIWWVALAIAMVTTALQLGYLGGSMTWLVLALMRSASTPAALPQASLQHMADGPN